MATLSEAFIVSGEGDAMNSTSTLKIHRPDTRNLIEKIKDEIKKRAEAKARRMMLKVPKRLAKR